MAKVACKIWYSKFFSTQLYTKKAPSKNADFIGNLTAKCFYETIEI